ncbi:MAG: DUF2505 domain-containing protein [Sandaracinaceae bacterium]
MSVRIADERVFAVSPDELFALFVDPSFQRARSAHLGTLSRTCNVETRGDEVRVVLDEVRDTGWKPHLFQSRRTIVWDRSRRRAEWTLEQTGGPGDASASGTLTLLEDPSGCRRRLEGALEVRVRFLGRMIEGVARRALRGEHDREASFIRRALAERYG